MSDFRNSLSQSTATLGISIIDEDPSEMSDTDLNSVTWHQEDAEMSKIFDFGNQGLLGKYLVIRYSCGSGAGSCL